MARATLLRGGFIYTADSFDTIHSHGSVLWRDGRILAVGDAADVAAHPAAADADILSGEGMMVLPGYVNPHWHDLSAMRLPFKGALRPHHDRGDEAAFMACGGDLTTISTVFASFGNLAEAMTDAEADAIAAYALWIQLRCGTTTLGDVGSLNKPTALIRAARRLGIRLSVSTWAADVVCPPDATTPRRVTDTDQVLAGIEALARDHAQDPRIRVRPSAAYGVNMSDELGKGLASIAARHQSGFATHVAALRHERAASLAYFGTTPIRRLDTLGLLNEGLLAIHPGFLDEEEARLLHTSGAHVSISPAKYGPTGESALTETGWIPRLRRQGVSVSLSTDGGPLPLGGMTEAMKTAWLTFNEFAADPTELLPTQALAMATRLPADALGWADQVGSIEAGKSADLLLIDRTDWRYLLNPRPLEALLGIGSSTDIDTVIAGGRLLIQNGSSVTGDENHLREDYLQALAAFSRRCLKVPAHDIERITRSLRDGGLR